MMLLVNFDLQLQAWANYKHKQAFGSSAGMAQSRYEERTGGGGSVPALPSGLDEGESIPDDSGRYHYFSVADLDLTTEIVLGGVLSHDYAEVIKAQYLCLFGGVIDLACRKMTMKAVRIGVSYDLYKKRRERAVCAFAKVWQSGLSKTSEGIPVYAVGARGQYDVSNLVDTNAKNY